LKPTSNTPPPRSQGGVGGGGGEMPESIGGPKLSGDDFPEDRYASSQ